MGDKSGIWLAREQLCTERALPPCLGVPAPLCVAHLCIDPGLCAVSGAGLQTHLHGKVLAQNLHGKHWELVDTCSAAVGYAPGWKLTLWGSTEGDVSAVSDLSCPAGAWT